MNVLQVQGAHETKTARTNGPTRSCSLSQAGSSSAAATLRESALTNSTTLRGRPCVGVVGFGCGGSARVASLRAKPAVAWSQQAS